MQKSYSEKYKDHRWLIKRHEIIERDSGMCRDCYDQPAFVNVHHLYYEPGKNPWEVDDDALILLCPDCHKVEHERFARYEGPKRDLSLRRLGFRAKDYEALCFFGVSVSAGWISREDAIQNVIKAIRKRNDSFEWKLTLAKRELCEEVDEW